MTNCPMFHISSFKVCTLYKKTTQCQGVMNRQSGEWEATVLSPHPQRIIQKEWDVSCSYPYDEYAWFGLILKKWRSTLSLSYYFPWSMGALGSIQSYVVKRRVWFLRKYLSELLRGIGLKSTRILHLGLAQIPLCTDSTFLTYHLFHTMTK